MVSTGFLYSILIPLSLPINPPKNVTGLSLEYLLKNTYNNMLF